ncbi:hypothetical protein L6164_013001 [Bauhinia variegata]|uniref:Uncharacterized protein n=1 Tax=Bauhinia variegata TaxID=167791 RepID=A0ACB9PEJ5_BAUVA|nr:hypothetical protein L6164_013001 [Bauhinia variegata]
MSSESLRELKELEFGPSSELLNMIPSSSVNRTQKLKKCTVRACDLLELAFDIDEDNYQHKELLPLLEELMLIDLLHMKRIWRQEPKNLVFKSLVFLELVRCDSLRTLFSISIASNLEKLELLELYDCKELEHVIEGQEGSANIVELKKLKQLILKHLPNLVNFCEGRCVFKLSELEIVRVKDIPKMEMFAYWTHETTKLKEFYITYVSNCWQGDLNETIKYLPKNPGGDYKGHYLEGHSLLKHLPTEVLLGLNQLGLQLKQRTARGPPLAYTLAGAVAKGKETRLEESTVVGDENPAVLELQLFIDLGTFSGMIWTTNWF